MALFSFLKLRGKFNTLFAGHLEEWISFSPALASYESRWNYWEI
jgi:hypothetical protein